MVEGDGLPNHKKMEDFDDRIKEMLFSKILLLLMISALLWAAAYSRNHLSIVLSLFALAAPSCGGGGGALIILEFIGRFSHGR
jgi:hypothetical protein